MRRVRAYVIVTAPRRCTDRAARLRLRLTETGDPMNFDSPTLLADLEQATASELDDVGFGVIRMDRGGVVLSFNRRESQLSGLSPQGVVGRNFFVEVAPCTNNFMVAERYAESDELDERLDYVFTYRMKPRPVRLRLLKRADGGEQYLVVNER
jgi:photoactive yellow protein